MNSFARTLAASLAAGVLVLAAPALAAAGGTAERVQTAQSSSQQAPQANGEIEKDFSDETLNAFIAAAEAVGQKLIGYREQMQNAGSQEEAASIQQAARQAALETIEATPGMDIETYKEVSQAARQDPDLMQKLQQMASAQQ